MKARFARGIRHQVSGIGYQELGIAGGDSYRSQYFILHTFIPGTEGGPIPGTEGGPIPGTGGAGVLTWLLDAGRLRPSGTFSRESLEVSVAGLLGANRRRSARAAAPYEDGGPC